jgi:adenylosuccinate synthase
MRVVVIGAQWGDEGKGKIVDFLAEDSSLIIRYAGGANAGHTIVIGDSTYKLHLIPSGIVSLNKKVILGLGMVIDLESMFTELKTLSDQGVGWQGRIFIADRAHIVLPRYKEQDKEQDTHRKRPIGTTGRGIGITYALKAARDGIRIGDIFEDDFFNRLSEADKTYLDQYKPKIQDMVIDLASFMHQHKHENILFEGAQGTLLDLDLGTYPFVSSGMSCAAGAAIGGAVGPKGIDTIVGVCKAYSTRVGNGPFPTQFDAEREGELEKFVRETGREYGVTTGRPRRCGYLDLVALRYACFTNSIDYLALTHLDVYDETEEIKCCTAYKINGRETKIFPASIEKLEKAEPVLKGFRGWKKSIKNCRRYDDLPVQAQEYLSFIEQYTGTKIGIVSVGYKRAETIIRDNPWIKS